MQAAATLAAKERSVVERHPGYPQSSQRSEQRGPFRAAFGGVAQAMNGDGRRNASIGFAALQRGYAVGGIQLVAGNEGRTVCEPDVRNARMLAFCRGLGGEVQMELELPHKRAALVVWER